MAKLKREIRAAICEWVDEKTREAEDNIKKVEEMSDKAKILSKMVQDGRTRLNEQYFKLIGEILEVATGEKFMPGDASLFVRGVMLVALNANNGNTYFNVSPALVYQDKTQAGYKKDGTGGNTFDVTPGSWRYATIEEINEFLDYFPDGRLMECFGWLPK